MGRGGEIFVLDMGDPVKIVDLARNLILLSGLRPDLDIQIEFTGMRPGEKLYEELSLVEEETIPTPDEKIRIFGGQGLEEADRAHPTSRPCGADQPCKNRVSTLAVIRDTYPSTSNDAGQVIEPAPKQAPPLGVS